MESEWTIGALGDVAKVQSGYAFKSGDMGESGHPVIKIKNIHPPDVDISDVQRVPPSIIEGNTRIGKFRLSKGDILIAMTGATVGKVGRMPKLSEPHYLNQRVGKVFVTDDAKADEDYVYYVLSQDGHVDQMLDLADGSAQPNISGTQIESLEVPLPPLHEQKAIAHILGTLDDKIELNRRMNATLEGMAQALFKSWFVDFDPVIDNALAAGNPIPDELADRAEVRRQALANGIANREAAKPFPDSFQETESMGWIPEGWEVSTINDECEIVGGGTPSTKNPDFWDDGEFPWVTPKDFSALQDKVLLSSSRFLTEAGLNKVSSGLLPKGTVLMSSRAPVGYLAITQIETAINQGFIGMICNKRLSPEFVLQWADSRMDDIKRAAGGSTFAEISKKAFRPFEVIVPSPEALDAYTETAGAIYNKISDGVFASNTLTKLRDTLLPKLISGELCIPEAEQLTVEALV